MKKKEISELSENELQVKLREEHEEQMNLRLKNAVGQVAKSHQIKAKRRNIARLETYLRQKRGN